MKTARWIIASLLLGDCLPSIDIYCKHIFILLPLQSDLLFAVSYHHYQFLAFPFGLWMPPWIFTKVLCLDFSMLSGFMLWGTLIICSC